MKVFVVLSTLLVASNAFVAPKLPSILEVGVPLAIGGKVVMIPKLLALKGAIGLTGLKIAGAHYLKRKVLVPASMAGAQAGYQKTSSVIAVPQNIAESKTAAVHEVFSKLPKTSPIEIEEVPVSPTTHFQQTIQVPMLPSPAIKWYKKPFTLMLPKMVLQQPTAIQKTFTAEQTYSNLTPSNYEMSEDIPEVGYGAAPVTQAQSYVFEL